MDLSYSEIDSIIDVIRNKSIDLTTRSVLSKLLKKNALTFESKKANFLSLRNDIEKIGTLEEALKLISENPSWEIPTASNLIEMIKLNGKGFEFRDSEYWVLSDNSKQYDRRDQFVIYNIITGDLLNRVTHDAYLDFDGGDFSTFTPFSKLSRGIRIIRNLN